MEETLFDQLKKSIESASLTEESSDQFSSLILNFCQSNYYCSASLDSVLTEGNKFEFRFTEIDAVDLPVLPIFTKAQGNEQHPFWQTIYPEPFSGVTFLKLALDVKFHLMMIENEKYFILSHPQLQNMIAILDVLSTKTATDSVSSFVPPALSPRLLATIYDYCEKNPEIETCFIAFHSFIGQNLTQPDLAVYLDSQNSSYHLDQLSTLLSRDLPADQKLLIVRDLPGQSRELRNKMTQQPPFYSKRKVKNWLSKLKSKIFPFSITWIQVNLSDN